MAFLSFVELWIMRARQYLVLAMALPDWVNSYGSGLSSCVARLRLGGKRL